MLYVGGRHATGAPQCKGKQLGVEKRGTKNTLLVGKPAIETREKSVERFLFPVFVNKVKCSMLRDSGSSLTIVNLNKPKLAAAVVPLQGQAMKISGMSDDLTIPLCKLTLKFTALWNDNRENDCGGYCVRSETRWNLGQ